MDNRDLYVALGGLVDANQENELSLADFLRGLRSHLEPHYGAAGLSPEGLVAAVGSALAGPPPAPDPMWRDQDLVEPDDDAEEDAAAVDDLIKSQVLDMEDAVTSGAMADEYRYFGIDVGRAPGVERASSSYYYNWDPLGYVECAARGSFIDRRPGDTKDLVLLSWAEVYDFILCGQIYE